MHSFCTISDGGTIAGESALMAFLAITVRQSHERPERMEEGVIIMIGQDLQRIIDSIDVVVKPIETIGLARIPKDYDVKQLSWKIARINFHYVNFSNREVWHEGPL